jgi:putative endonuclease
MEKYNKRSIGSQKEELAANYLLQQGYEIIQMNFFCRSGEIDIVAKDNDYLVFIEVKYRLDSRLGLPQEAVNYYKIKSIVKTAKYYLYKHGMSEETKCRFDVVAIEGNEISLIQDAFYS